MVCYVLCSSGTGSRGAKDPWSPPDFEGIEKRTESKIEIDNLLAVAPPSFLGSATSDVQIHKTWD